MPYHRACIGLYVLLQGTLLENPLDWILPREISPCTQVERSIKVQIKFNFLSALLLILRWRESAIAFETLAEIKLIDKSRLLRDLFYVQIGITQ